MLSNFEIDGLISRKRRRRAHQRLDTSYDPIDSGTCLNAILSDYNSDTEEPDEVATEEVSANLPTANPP